MTYEFWGETISKHIEFDVFNNCEKKRENNIEKRKDDQIEMIKKIELKQEAIESFVVRQNNVLN